jgi:hypothetical protein
MKTRFMKFLLIGTCLLVLAGTLLMVNFEGHNTNAEQKVSAANVIHGSDTQVPIPTPIGAQTFSPAPTPQNNTLAQRLASSNEQTHVGPITLVPPTPPADNRQPARFSIREDIPDWEPVTEPNQYVPPRKLFVLDNETGKEVRLGEDYGDAFFEEMTDQYVIWRYQRYGHPEGVRLSTGLYAYVLATGEQLVIAQDPEQPGFPEIDDQWVIYVAILGARDYFVDLHAYNLETGKDLLVGSGVPYNRPFDHRPSSNYYAINGDKIVWIAVDTNGPSIFVYDLTAQTTQLLDLVGTIAPVDPMISEDIVIWWDYVWTGYDLQTEATFTFSLTPPGWENISWSTARPLRLVNEQLYWALEVNDEAYHFTAPIIREP